MSVTPLSGTGLYSLPVPLHAWFEQCPVTPVSTVIEDRPPKLHLWPSVRHPRLLHRKDGKEGGPGVPSGPLSGDVTLVPTLTD